MQIAQPTAQSRKKWNGKKGHASDRSAYHYRTTVGSNIDNKQIPAVDLFKIDHQLDILSGGVNNSSAAINAFILFEELNFKRNCTTLRTDVEQQCITELSTLHSCILQDPSKDSKCGYIGHSTIVNIENNVGEYMDKDYNSAIDIHLTAKWLLSEKMSNTLIDK